MMNDRTPSRGPARVMVAEDDAEMAHVLEFLLAREGYSVRVARDGREALRVLAEEDPVDVVVMDVMMPFAKRTPGRPGVAPDPALGAGPPSAAAFFLLG